MKQISVGESALLSSPHLFAAIVTKGGKINVMGVSWFTFVSLRDSKLLFCISGKGYTGGVIKETKKASLCMVTEPIKDIVMECCRTSGAVTDKTEAIGVKIQEIEGFDTPVLEGAGVCWDLELSEAVTAGDHTVFIMDIKNAVQLNDGPQVLAFEGYKRLATL
jgi:flavin reductase (DIM6/NTAB) family NADH-FMN oxidoreductase RutF